MKKFFLLIFIFTSSFCFSQKYIMGIGDNYFRAEIHNGKGSKIYMGIQKMLENEYLIDFCTPFSIGQPEYVTLKFSNGVELFYKCELNGSVFISDTLYNVRGFTVNNRNLKRINGFTIIEIKFFEHHSTITVDEFSYVIQSYSISEPHLMKRLYRIALNRYD